MKPAEKTSAAALAAVVIAVAGGFPQASRAQTLMDAANGDVFDFTWGDVTATNNGTSITLTEAPSLSFGGAGEGLGELTVDAASSSIEVIYKALPGNTAATFTLTLQDTDPNTSGVEDYFYAFDIASGTPVDNGFVSLAVPLLDHFAVAPAFEQNAGDEVPNFGLTGFSIQLGTPGEGLALELRSVSIVPVPEPGGLALLGLAGAAAILHRPRAGRRP